MFWLLQLLCFVCVAFGKTLPNTVDQLSVSSYLGGWYQVYGSPTNTIFQGYGECITANYGLLEDGDVSVLNTQINENNEVETINGYAYYKNLSEPGKLTVHLNGVPIDSAYWVVKLGEIVNDEYQYSIITTPSGISLWVLARDVDTFFTKYNDEVVEFLTKYNFYYTLINQQNCDYKYNIYSKKSQFSYLRREAASYNENKQVKLLNKNHENYVPSLRGYLNNLSDCPEGTSSCEYLPGSYQCCPSNEYCIPNVGCRC
jgi:lipocalin